MNEAQNINHTGSKIRVKVCARHHPIHAKPVSWERVKERGLQGVAALVREKNGGARAGERPHCRQEGIKVGSVRQSRYICAMAA